jgi:hypothetical protein
LEDLRELVPWIDPELRNEIFSTYMSKITFDRNDVVIMMETLTDEEVAQLLLIELSWFFHGYLFESLDEALPTLYWWKRMVMNAHQSATSKCKDHEGFGPLVESFETVSITMATSLGTITTTKLRILNHKKIPMKRELEPVKRSTRASTVAQRDDLNERLAETGAGEVRQGQKRKRSLEDELHYPLNF